MSRLTAGWVRQVEMEAEHLVRSTAVVALYAIYT
jgi:hypothetical protein